MICACTYVADVDDAVWFEVSLGVIFWIKVLYTSVGEAHENQIKDVDDAYVLEPSD